MQDRDHRTLLLLATHFYPSMTVAAVRWSSLARALPGHGWRVVVLTRCYGSVAGDEGILDEFGPDVRVRYIDHPADGQPAPTGTNAGAGGRNAGVRRSAFSSLRVAAERLCFVPDPSVVFWRRARARLLDEALSARPDIVAVSAPPWGKVGAAMGLAKRLGKPLVVDQRDPFLIDHRFGPYGLRSVHSRALAALSARIYRESSLVVHTIPIESRWARLRYPEARPRIRALTNAFPLKMTGGGIEPMRDPAGRRSVRVVGAMGAEEMVHLAQAVRALADKGLDVSLMLVGRTPATADRIEGVLGDRVQIVGKVPHERALSAILGADVLVNYLDSDRRRSLLLSTKLFEYVAAGKPVLEINPTRSDRHFVRRLPGVEVLSDPTLQELSSAIERALNGSGTPVAEARERVLREGSWAAQAERLAGWLDDLAEGRPFS